MKQEPDFFGDRPLDLVYIAKRLEEALATETKLTEAGIDYLVEVDYYLGGVIFRRERAGAFFYVESEHKAKALGVLGCEAPIAPEEKP
ncbi:MAG: hypothetical protein U0Q16_12645 [Bryobacteraceae bacterium]